MSLNLSDEELQKITDQLFLLKTPKPTPLQKPTTSTGANSLSAKLDPIGSDARFKDLGIGVVDFTHDRMDPAVWIYNGDTAWRIGSTAKICILLAAVQLRDDVRKVKDTGLISSPAQFDELFSTIWRRSSKSNIRRIAKKGASPRISTIFDVTKTRPDFFGADIQVDDSSTRKAIVSRLSGANGHEKLTWSKATEFSFWERLWLTGARSDNVAASTCISEIGVDYLVGVLGAYGLYDETHGMHLLLGRYYAHINTKTPVTTTSLDPNLPVPKYRPWPHLIQDEESGAGQVGSVAALTAYMIALVQENLIDKDGCNTIRTHLSDGKALALTSYISLGVQDSGAIVSEEFSKIGILRSLLCEFTYLKAGGLEYAVLATGILPKKVGATTFRPDDQAKGLGEAVHTALSKN